MASKLAVSAVAENGLASQRHPIRRNPHDRRIPHLPTKARLGAASRGTLWPGTAGAHEIIAARRLLAHRSRPAESHYPRLALRQFRDALSRSRRGDKARRLAAQYPRVRRGAGERSLHTGAVLAEARAAPTGRHLRDTYL